MEVAGRAPAGLDARFSGLATGRSPACRAPAGQGGGAPKVHVCVSICGHLAERSGTCSMAAQSSGGIRV